MSIQPQVMGVDFGGQSNSVAIDGDGYSLKDYFGSPEEFFRSVFDRSGEPRSLVIAAAGFEGEEGVKLTHRPEWGFLSPARFRTRRCEVVEIIHDMDAKKKGLPFAERLPIVEGNPAPGIEPVLLTISSGVGQEGTESGHATWQPRSELEDSLLESLQLAYPWQDFFSIENVLGGMQQANLYRGLLFHGLTPDYELRCRLNTAILAGRDIGPILSEGYLEHNPFCEKAGEVIGSLMGQFTRNVQVTTRGGARGGIGITGGGMPREFLRALVARTEMKRVRVGGSHHNEWIGDTPIFLVEDPLLGAYGAREHARTLIAA